MAEIIITDRDLSNKDLSFPEIFTLKVIYYKEKNLFDIFKYRAESESEMEYFKFILNTLQNKNYIKTIGLEFEDQFIRPKCEEIFKKEESQSKEIIQYLNMKLGSQRGFSATSAANKRVIQARLKDYSVQDLKDVIDIMVAKWKGTDMEKYIRPETLFNETKFQGYYVMSGTKRTERMSINTML